MTEGRKEISVILWDFMLSLQAHIANWMLKYFSDNFNRISVDYIGTTIRPYYFMWSNVYQWQVDVGPHSTVTVERC